MTNTTNTNQPTDSNGNNLITVANQVKPHVNHFRETDLIESIEQYLEIDLDEDDFPSVPVEVPRHFPVNTVWVSMEYSEAKQILKSRFNKVVNGLGVIVDAS